MHDEKDEFIKKMHAILDFIQCQIKLFTNLHITYLKYNILSYILTVYCPYELLLYLQEFIQLGVASCNTLSRYEVFHASNVCLQVFLIVVETY